MLCLYFLRPLADSTEMKLVFDEAMAEIEGKRLNEEMTFLSVFVSQMYHPPKELWNDSYGNFILQRLLEFGTVEIKEEIGNRLQGDSISLSTRVYGW